MEPLPLNPGVIVLSPMLPNRPVMVCGQGRGGTSALMAGLVAGGWPCCCTDPSGPTYEWIPLTKAWFGTSKETAWELIETARSYNPHFAVKVPNAEQRPSFLPWAGNWIAVTRDAVAGAARQGTLDSSASGAGLILQRIAEQHHSLVNLIGLATQGDGVILVSYERLLTDPLTTLTNLESWLGITLNKDAAARRIEPSCRHYREVQAENLSRP